MKAKGMKPVTLGRRYDVGGYGVADVDEIHQDL